MQFYSWGIAIPDYQGLAVKEGPVDLEELTIHFSHTSDPYPSKTYSPDHMLCMFLHLRFL